MYIRGVRAAEPSSGDVAAGGRFAGCTQWRTSGRFPRLHGRNLVFGRPNASLRQVTVS